MADISINIGSIISLIIGLSFGYGIHLISTKLKYNLYVLIGVGITGVFLGALFARI